MRNFIDELGVSLFVLPALGCNSILGLERAELAATVAGRGGESSTAGSDGGRGPTSLSGAAATPLSVSQANSVGGGGTTSATGVGLGGSHLPTAAGGVPAAGCAGAASGGLKAAAGECSAGSGATGGGCEGNAQPVYSCLGQWLVSCAEDGTTRSIDCTKPELCDSAHAECDRCLAGETSCIDDRRQSQCAGDGQSQTTALCESYCSSGKCVACLNDSHCADPGECVDALCTSEHACGQKHSAKGTSCRTTSGAGVCDGAGHCGSCTPDERRCSATGVPELCVTSGAGGGQWVAQPACRTATSTVPFTCIAGTCQPPPSCRGVSAEHCGGSASEHCCSAPVVPGAEYIMGTNGTSPEISIRERPAHRTIVGALRLDAFEVTVGRFRQFVTHYEGPPAAGAGADPHQTPMPIGWQPEWNERLPKAGPDAAAAIVQSLLPELETSTWTDLPGQHENHPINHVPWYLAFAFCAYDGGWLPSEAEWELAASGTMAKSTYPWGNAEPTTEHAVFELSCPPATCATKDAFRAVGSAPKGAGPFGHYDLAGNVSEWTMDYYDEAYYQQFSTSRCEYCINTTTSYYRVTRGGHGLSKAPALRVTARGFAAPTSSSAGIGFRCARPI